LVALLNYWKRHPPVHILMQGMASGFSGVTVGTPAPQKVDDKPPNFVTDAEEFVKMVQGTGLSIGVMQLPKSQAPVGVLPHVR